jgi:uncharacterized membrane protein YfhO
VKYHLVKRGNNATIHSFFKPVKIFGDVTLYENSEFLPLGFTYDAFLPNSAFIRFGHAKRSNALFKAIIVDDQDIELLAGLSILDESLVIPSQTNAELRGNLRKLRGATLQITQHRHGHIEGTIETERPTALFFSIPYDTGWMVRIDGEIARSFKANVGFLGVLLPAGKHEVALSYTPVLVREGMAVSSLALLAFIGVVVRDRRHPINLRDL